MSEQLPVLPSTRPAADQLQQVHRGHSVFDTCEVVRGHLYCLDEHFKRFLTSAALAGIQLSMTQAQMYRAILETAAASEKMDCESPARVRSCMPA